MKENYPKAAVFTFGEEGWKANIKGDVGGRTILGVTEHFYPKDFAAMLNMTLEQAKAYALDFYKRTFWNPMGCDNMPYPLDCVAFDCSVNPGPSWTHHQLMIVKDWRQLNEIRRQHYKDTAKANVVKGLINRCDATIKQYGK